MSTTIISSDIDHTASDGVLLESDGSDLFVLAGVSVIAENGFYGIEFDGMDNAAEIDGTVVGAVGFYCKGSDSSLVIGTSAVVAGIGGNAIVFGLSNESITNAGDIQSATADGIFLQGNVETIDNSGTIAAATSGIDILGLESDITNSGRISGTMGIFIHYFAPPGFGTDTVDNSGTIIDAGQPSVTYGVDDFSGQLMHLTNEGYIRAGTGVSFAGTVSGFDLLSNTGTVVGNGVAAVREIGGSSLHVLNYGRIVGIPLAVEFIGGAGINLLDNSGLISGDISTTPDSALNVVNSGHIDGIIQTGFRSSSYDGSQGTLNGEVIGAGGNDTMLGGAANDHFDGGAGDDTLSGGGGNDTLAAEGAVTTIDGGDGYDTINLSSFFNAADRIEGGAGIDTLNISGNYSAGVTLGPDTLSDVERLVMADGNTYKLVMDDGNVAAGGEMRIDASALTGTNTLKFFGENETDGRYVVYGGAGNDNIIGGAGNDILYGNAGANRFTGGLGADRIIATGASERFLYADVTESTSTTHDIITGFIASGDRFDLDVTVTGVDSAVTSGTLRAGTFDANLASAIGAAQLGAGHAVLFTASAGNLSGHTYLVVDANGVAGYQAGQDYVMELVGGNLTGLSTADFI